MLDDVREAAIDRALVGNDPKTALALPGLADGAARDHTNNNSPDDAVVAVVLTVGAVAAADRRSLDDRAWRPGTDPDPHVVAGAAVAVRMRNIAVERAAALADCTPATLEATVERQRRQKKL